ncbi:MAG: inositol polyphosphate 5-phosphatase [Geoglossum umbratile]|nr:MAG: inositol polyphosphate 5-phosphatase [Geoglossum umbratile]
MSIRILRRDHPHRAIALITPSHALIFRHSVSTTNRSFHSLQTPGPAGANKCMVEFSVLESVDLKDYKPLSPLPVQGTLGLITINNDVFICVVSGDTRVATVRPGEIVQRIDAVEFHCLNNPDYDDIPSDEITPYLTDTSPQDGFEYAHQSRKEPVFEHPCSALKKLLSGGTFYYSVEFDLTNRLQDRSIDASTFDIDNLDDGFLWNSYMIRPLVEFRSRLGDQEREALDLSRILTSAIRGFVQTITIPASTSPFKTSRAGLPSTITLISRLSCRRAGTRFNARGIDDDGNVANFVESETVLWSPSGLCFSYAQIRGSVPIFWEQATGLLPNQQKIQVTRSPEATQPAFDKHFETLEVKYGAIHVLNLLSESKPGEVDLTNRYRYHVRHSSLNTVDDKDNSLDHQLLRETEYDFHAETKGSNGYEAASAIRHLIQRSAGSFGYFLSDHGDNSTNSGSADIYHHRRSIVVLQQEGIFRTNCLDCLDRTNLIQTIVSQMAVESFLSSRSADATPDFLMRHSTLWADNGDVNDPSLMHRTDNSTNSAQSLSKIYAGTGALKSSFTRHGKMSIAGAIADARKSATRMYINNFADKGRQNTIDVLLGRLMGQTPVHLFDPINDFVTSELKKRAVEYSSTKPIHILVGTFNLNGQTNDLKEDLSSWLCPNVGASQRQPEIVAVGFQEIVELSPQQIMSTDPARRQMWENAVRKTLNENAVEAGSEEYVLLRSGQLVGAALAIFVRSSVLRDIKNVEGSVKKTGMSGMAGNKGAVAIRMDYASTQICFVTAHLAAGFSNYDERNRDYRTINHGLRFQRNRSIDDHDTVIWLGDFNYRIGLSDERVRRLIHMGDLDSLYENDQLNLQMVAGLTFPFYSEARITFMPTYKYDNGTDNYDTSEKARIPAWCDRILRKGSNLRQINYNTAPLRFSDHRPVYATFQCTVSLVNEQLKERLSQDIYEHRRREVRGSIANTKTSDTDDEGLVGYDPIAPGLPPASSDRRKWWLDNGLPARSIVEAPGADFGPNPHRSSNPFTPIEEPDWVRRPKTLQAGTKAAYTPVMSTPGLTQKHAKVDIRKIPPPYNGPERGKISATDPSRSPMPQIPNQPSARLNQFSASTIEGDVSRKRAPPIPKKPVQLSSKGSRHSSVGGEGKDYLEPQYVDDYMTAPSSMHATPRFIPEISNFPPPVRRPAPTNERRSLTGDREPVVSHLKNTLSKLGDPRGGPPLPPRGRSTTERKEGLIDGNDEDMQNMASWEPLRPG